MVVVGAGTDSLAVAGAGAGLVERIAGTSGARVSVGCA